MSVYTWIRLCVFCFNWTWIRLHVWPVPRWAAECAPTVYLSTLTPVCGDTSFMLNESDVEKAVPEFTEQANNVHNNLCNVFFPCMFLLVSCLVCFFLDHMLRFKWEKTIHMPAGI